jgi:hypothetical protein
MRCLVKEPVFRSLTRAGRICLSGLIAVPGGLTKEEIAWAYGPAAEAAIAELESAGLVERIGGQIRKKRYSRIILECSKNHSGIFQNAQNAGEPGTDSAPTRAHVELKLNTRKSATRKSQKQEKQGSLYEREQEGESEGEPVRHLPPVSAPTLYLNGAVESAPKVGQEIPPAAAESVSSSKEEIPPATAEPAKVEPPKLDTKAVFTEHQKLFEALAGSKPKPYTGRDAVLIAPVLRQYGTERTLALLQKFFENADQWTHERGYTIATFVSQIDRLLMSETKLKRKRYDGDHLFAIPLRRKSPV